MITLVKMFYVAINLQLDFVAIGFENMKIFFNPHPPSIFGIDIISHLQINIVEFHPRPYCEIREWIFSHLFSLMFPIRVAPKLMPYFRHPP